MRNNIIKYVIFFTLLIGSLYLLTGCKLKHAFRGQEITIPIRFKDNSNTKVRHISKQEMKEFQEIIKRDRGIK